MSTPPAVVDIQFVDPPHEPATQRRQDLLARAWALTDRHRLAERSLTISRPATPDAQISCCLGAHFGGPLLLVIGRGETVEEAIEAAIAEAEAR